MAPIIKVENLSKQYRLGTVGTGTIKDDVKRWWHRIRGKEDPFLRIGETNDRSQKGNSDYVWALNNINFEVQPGEVLGIIGRNGAGKSTLLKILSRVTEPTTGRITMNGRVASLLEVGTGFHPDLTGRENIYLNGAILGMSKAEINRKLDEIVDFSGVERYIDTPVKRYSSGMYVRLGFAVAAHLEPEILIVDEVLAVGDAEFQKKCLGKMKDVSTREGRTVLFVSHHMTAIQKLCDRAVLLNNGGVEIIANTEQAIEYYLKTNANKTTRWVADRYKSTKAPVYFTIITAQLLGEQPNHLLQVDFEIASSSKSGDIFFAFNINAYDQTTVLQAIPNEFNRLTLHAHTTPNTHQFVATIQLPPLIPGLYSVSAWVGADYSQTYDWQQEIISFEIVKPPNYLRLHPHNSSNGYLMAHASIEHRI